MIKFLTVLTLVVLPIPSIAQTTNVDITQCSSTVCPPVGAGHAAGSSPVVIALDNGSTLPINVSTATTTQVVPAVSGQLILVTGGQVVVSSPQTITFEYGTGTNCGTGTHPLTGPMKLVASSGPLSLGDAAGASMIVPAGNALCLVTSAAVQTSGWITFAR